MTSTPAATAESTPPFHYPVDADGIMKVYSPSRTGLVFAKI